jgi:ketosteroid isomerase-like protein
MVRSILGFGPVAASTPSRWPVAAVAALAALAAGCGGSDTPSEEDRVRAVLADFGRATAAKDYDRLCSSILAPALVEQVTSIGLACPAALRQGLGEVSEPRIAVGAVRVTGDSATAEVSSSARGQQPSRDTLELRRVREGWRIASLGGQDPAPAPVEP